MARRTERKLAAEQRIRGACGALDRSHGRWWPWLLSLAFLGLLGSRCSSVAPDGGLEFVPLVCRSPRVATRMEHIHYPEDDCRAAVRKAEDRLSSGHYRRACQQLAPAAGLPTKVVEVRATACFEAASLDDYEGGSGLWLDSCCP